MYPKNQNPTNFLRSQQLEPMVGGPPESELMHSSWLLEELGIRGQSIYTALFHHVGMETLGADRGQQY